MGYRPPAFPPNLDDLILPPPSRVEIMGRGRTAPPPPPRASEDFGVNVGGALPMTPLEIFGAWMFAGFGFGVTMFVLQAFVLPAFR